MLTKTLLRSDGIALAILLACSMLAAQPAASPMPAPTSAPAASPAPAPAASTSQSEPISPQIEKILDDCEAAGDKTFALRAKFKYARLQKRVANLTERDGSVLYLRKVQAGEPEKNLEKLKFENPEGKTPPALPDQKFGKIRFDNLKEDLFTSTKPEIYSFYDRFVHELNYKTMQLVHRELVPEGQVIDPFRLGEGVFPIPFGQKKKDMLAHFAIRLIPAADKDPADSDHLELTPRPDSDMARRNKGKNLLLHLYIDRRLHLPVRIVNETRDERITVDFSAIEINPKITEQDFKLEKPAGFQETTVPLNK